MPGTHYFFFFSCNPRGGAVLTMEVSPAISPAELVFWQGDSLPSPSPQNTPIVLSAIGLKRWLGVSCALSDRPTNTRAECRTFFFFEPARCPEILPMCAGLNWGCQFKSSMHTGLQIKHWFLGRAKMLAYSVFVWAFTKIIFPLETASENSSACNYCFIIAFRFSFVRLPAFWLMWYSLLDP